MLQQVTSSELPQIYRIMKASFPDDEYRPYEEQLALFQNPEYQIYGMSALDQPDQLAGFLAVWEFETFTFLEHFAVDPVLRNGGVGSAMLKELVEKSAKPVCLEVELPEDELARRRVGFYERNGFVFHHYPYMQPPISKGKSPVPLRIMAYGRELTRQEFDAVKQVLYQRVYHC